MLKRLSCPKQDVIRIAPLVSLNTRTFVRDHRTFGHRLPIPGRLYRAGRGALAVLLFGPLVVSVRVFGRRLRRAPQTRIMALTSQPGSFSEPSVAIDPHDPQHVVVAYQDNAHVAYSFDAGRDWASSSVAPRNYSVSGDVSVTYDNRGHAIVCFIAFDKLGTYNYWAHDGGRNGIFIRRSLDGGKTWEPRTIAVIKHPTKVGIPWEDKPYIVADQTGGPFSGNLYVGWTRWTLANSEIMFSRSTDDGKTWSPPIEIDNHPGLPRDDNGADEGFSGTIGPDGTLYVVWADGSHIVFTTSRNGGRTFARTRDIIHTAPIMFKVQDVSRSNGFPVIAIDPRGPKRGGRLYVAWGDYRNGDLDVFCATSADHGLTWSPAVRVNSDPVHDGADQFFPWLAVDPITGAANIVFYDRRSDPTNNKSIIVLARSTDGGRRFVNYAWTRKPFDPHGTFIGDYTGLAARAGRVYGAWTIVPSGAVPASSRHAPYHHDVVQAGVAVFSKR